MGVLKVVMALDNRVKVPQIAPWLDLAPSLMDNVIFGPAKALFQVDIAGRVSFSTRSFKDFLLDASRSGDYFIPSNKSDTLFLEVLSRQPPSDPSQSYPREVLMGVLRVVMSVGNGVTVPQIASWLDVAPSLVANVIFGPAKGLFRVDDIVDHVTFSTLFFKEFLLDASRAGEYFMDDSDTLFTRMLSHQPPLHSNGLPFPRRQRQI